MCSPIRSGWIYSGVRNLHLAFGAGGHSCIGATLIRRAASNAITEFVKHLGKR